MKKLFLILFLIVNIKVFALNVTVESLEDVENVQETPFSAKVLDSATFKDGFGFDKDDIIEGVVIESVEAKRGKRSGYIVITPKAAYRNGFKRPYDFNDLEAKALNYNKKDWKKTGAKASLGAGLTVGSFWIPGLSQMFYFSKGVIKPYENKSRFKSGLQSVWDNSPLVYIEKGEDLNIEKGDLVTLKFYHPSVSKWRYFKRTK